ncbi:MAG: hypothetical protein PHF86_01625 [Candidatus Nanoarchaeia archaeon]|nr:hypothetical protein [Candidatus Nanoarchaeia archaeon]
MNNFLKSGFNIKPKTSSKIFFSNKRTVCIEHQDGKITEHPGITDPWRYITKVKQSIDVKNAWIKDE